MHGQQQLIEQSPASSPVRMDHDAIEREILEIVAEMVHNVRMLARRVDRVDSRLAALETAREVR